MNELYHIFQILFMGVFAQFQPLTQADAGATFTYEVLIADDSQGLLGITVEEAAEDGRLAGFVLMSDYVNGVPMERWLRAGLVFDDTTRYVQQVGSAEAVFAETLYLPSNYEAATLGFGDRVAFRALDSGVVSLPTADGDTVDVNVRTFDYDDGRGEGGGLSVSVSPEFGVVAASLYQPGTAPVRMRLRPTE